MGLDLWLSPSLLTPFTDI